MIVYDELSVAPERAGNQLAARGAVINTYPTADNQGVLVTSGTPRSVQNVATLLGLPAEDYASVDYQLAHRQASMRASGPGSRCDPRPNAWPR